MQSGLTISASKLKIKPFWVAVIFALAGGVGAFVPRLASKQPLLAVLPLTVVPALVIFRFPQFGLAIYALLTFAADWLTVVVLDLPQQVLWIKDAILLVMVLRVLFQTLVGRRKLWTTYLDKVSLVFLVVSILSTLIRPASVTGLITGWRRPWRFILLFYVLINTDMALRKYRRWIIALMILAFVQPIVMVFQVLAWIPSNLGTNDLATGTFLDARAAALFMVQMICLLVGLAVVGRIRISRLLLLLVYLASGLILSESGGAIYLTLPTIMVTVFLSANLSRALGRRRPVWVAGFLIAMLIVTLLAIWLATVVWENSSLYLNITRLVKQELEGRSKVTGKSGRLFAIVDTLEILGKEPLGRLLGLGPGNWSSSAFGSFEAKQVATHGLVLKRTQVTVMIAEFGLIGFIVYSLLFWQFYRPNRRAQRFLADPFWKAVSIGFTGIVFLTWATGVYNVAWYHESISFPLWFIGAALHRLLEEQRSIDSGTKYKVANP